MSKSILRKLILLFVSVMFLVNVAFYCIYSMYSEPLMMKELNKALYFVTENIYRHSSLAEISDSLKNSFFQLDVFDTTESLSFSKHAKLYLNEPIPEESYTPVFAKISERKKGVFSSKFPAAIMKIETDDGPKYIVVYPDYAQSFINTRALLLQFIVFFMISAIMIIIPALTYTTKSVRKLVNATKEIAAGNFTIEIENKREDEIGKLIDHFNLMAKELRSIEILRNSFISDISHEFKTPLTTIEGYTTLLATCKTKEEQKRYAAIITEETKRLSMLSSNILLLNRIENENILVETSAFRLDEQIRKVIMSYEQKWSAKNIELDIELEEVKYYGSEYLLYQIWSNLLDNAIKFSPNGEIIEVRLYKSNRKCIFTIQDNGIGILEDQENRLFDKFYKADKARSDEGNGLGLSIVKRAVELHKGNVSVKSAKNRGCRFVVTLSMDNIQHTR